MAGAEPLGIAVSGGSDSMALLWVAVSRARARGLTVEAATVDHALRPGSAAEAAEVGAFCRTHGIRHETLRIGTLSATGNLSGNARVARYEALTGWARRRRLAALATAHTADDQAETVLMRLARRAGAEGLAGIPEERSIGAVRVIRPTLSLRRDALRAMLTAAGIPWADDPTNDDHRYQRVRARGALAALAPLGLSVEDLAATAARLTAQCAVLEAAVADLRARAWQMGVHGEILLGAAPLAAAPRETALSLIAEAVRDVAGGHYPPRARALEQALEAGLGRTAPTTLAGCCVWAGTGSAVIAREPAAAPPAVPVQEGVLWDGRWRVAGTVPAPDLMLGPLNRVSNLADARAADQRLSESLMSVEARLRPALPAISRAGNGALVALPTLGWGPPQWGDGAFVTLCSRVVALDLDGCDS